MKYNNMKIDRRHWFQTFIIISSFCLFTFVFYEFVSEYNSFHRRTESFEEAVNGYSKNSADVVSNLTEKT